MKKVILITAALAGTPALAAQPVVEQLMNEYRAGTTEEFSAERGRALWTQEVVQKGETRSCATCHNSDLRKDGRHASSGKTIRAMAPSVNASRLTERAKIEKWFGRNCKWTYGRTCTPEEKGHFLAYIQNQ